MKLVDPIDDQLNACFAEKVAGWTYFLSKDGHYKVTNPEGQTFEPWFGRPPFDPYTGEKLVHRWTDGIDLPCYVTSADAVLPWLEKFEWNCIMKDPKGWCVAVENGNVNSMWQFCTGKTGNDKSLARAAVIALLRAHGVEVEFSK